jgi:DNA-binding NarL/FixJ family response regulator
METCSRGIKVMLGCGQPEVLAAWLPRLLRECDFDIQECRGADVLGNALLDRRRASVFVLDRALLDGIDVHAFRKVCEGCERMRVLLLSDQHEHHFVIDMLRNGFHGVLRTSSPPEMCVKAIRAVANGDIWLPRASLVNAIAEMQRSLRTVPNVNHQEEVDASDWLSPRQMEILSLVRLGWTNKQIARRLGIMEDTVKKHLQTIFGKLGVRRRRALVVFQAGGDTSPEIVPRSRRYLDGC